MGGSLLPEKIGAQLQPWGGRAHSHGAGKGVGFLLAVEQGTLGRGGRLGVWRRHGRRSSAPREEDTREGEAAACWWRLKNLRGGIEKNGQVSTPIYRRSPRVRVS